ncbi:MAG TPA: response regulator [Rhabdochlamydiaceae bacterium]|jgi:phosphoribosyl 1,2-cyclic phosphodiesterase
MKEKKKILFADADHALYHKIKQIQGAKAFEWESASSGIECWDKIESFQPDLVVIDLMLPHIHGIEILRKIKIAPRTQQTGVILTSYCASIQNYHSALTHNVDFFLEKPFEPSRLLSLVALFFKHKLHCAPFQGKGSQALGREAAYHPKTLVHSSYLRFWGTRGSNPVSGPDYVRFGGNTSCLEVRCKEDLVIFDAGTGIRPLGNLFSEKPPKSIHLILSHFHFDHLYGFPFFGPIYNPNCQVHIWTPIGYEKSAREIFSEMLTYTLFPVRLDDMQAKVTFHDIQEGVPFSVGNISINSHYAYHPGATLCFKIQCGKTVFGYVTDNEFLMGYHGTPRAITKNHRLLDGYQSQLKFFKGCDLLIHEAQYTSAEYLTKVGWGHSSVSNAAALINLIDVKDWIITHHDPKHSDTDLFKKTQLQFDILDDLDVECRTRMAFDGLTVPLR